MHHTIMNPDETLDVVPSTIEPISRGGGFTTRRYSEDGSVILLSRRLGKIYKISGRGRNIPACFNIPNDCNASSCVTGGDTFAVTLQYANGSYYGRYSNGTVHIVGNLQSKGLSLVNRDGTRVYYSRNDSATLSYIDNGRNIDTSIEICCPIVTSENAVYGGRGGTYLCSWDIRCNFIDQHEVPTTSIGSVLSLGDSLVIHEYIGGDEESERTFIYDIRNRAIYDGDNIGQVYQRYITYFYI